MSSEDTTMIERITYLDPETMHYQATFADPKTFTRPWTMVQALRRLHAKGMDFVELEDTTVENCDEEVDPHAERRPARVPGNESGDTKVTVGSTRAAAGGIARGGGT